MTRDDGTVLGRMATGAWNLLEGTKRSDAIHSDGRHDMHLHARIRGDE